MHAMLIKNVKLHNIRSYLAQEVTFPEGTVLLSGDIGSGKSTILLAIEFALFGISSSRGLLSGDALLRHGKQSGYVELSFSFDGKDVLIRRTLKRANDSVRQDEGFISINGLRQVCTAEELKARVLEMLGYPRELLKKSKGLIYRYTVYTPQEEMKRILSEDPQVRLDTLRRVFQIEKYKLVKEGSIIVLQALRERKRELAARIEDLPQKQEQLSGVSAQIELAGKELAALKPGIGEVEASVSRAQAGLKLLDERSRQLNLLRSQLAAANALVSEKVRLIASRESEVSLARKEIASLQSALSDNSSALAQLSSSLSRLKSFSDSLLTDVEGKKLLESELLSAEQLRLELESEISRAEALKLSSQQLRERIAALSSCPTCLQQVHPDHRHRVSSDEEGKIAGFSARISFSSERRASLASRMAGLRSGLVDLQLKEKIAAGLSSELRHYFDLASALNVPIVSVQDSVKQVGQSVQPQLLQQSFQPLMSVAEMQTELAALSAAKRSLESFREKAMLISEKERAISVAEGSLASWRAEVYVLEKKRAELASAAELFGDLDAQSAILKSELDKLLNDYTGLMVKRAALEKEKETSLRQAEILADEVRSKEAAKREFAGAANLSYWLDEVFSNLVSVIEKHVMMKVHREFNGLFTEWFSILIGTDAISARIDDEFTPVVEANGFEILVENLSGGEKTSCALAYRLALNMVINSLVSTIKTKDLLILDEPTDGFSAEQLDKLRDVLVQLQLQQIILVSHEDRIESFVQSIIRIEKEQHVSRVLV